ncbi:hypothetical protein [Natroniella sp. ANB-PHB2]
MNDKLKKEVEFLRKRVVEEAGDKDLLDKGVQAVSWKLANKIVEMIKGDS